MPYELSPEAKQKIKAELEYREVIERELASLRPKPPWWKKISAFFGHAFIIAVFGGTLVTWFQANQAAKQENLTRKQQLQDRQYTLLANFSNEFDQYTALLINIRYDQILFAQSRTNENQRDFLGRSKVEVLPMYLEMVKQMHERPRGEGVLASIRALFHSLNVLKQVDALDKCILNLQHGEPGNGDLTEKQITDIDMEMDQLVRGLAVAMRQEMEANK